MYKKLADWWKGLGTSATGVFIFDALVLFCSTLVPLLIYNSQNYSVSWSFWLQRALVFSSSEMLFLLLADTYKVYWPNAGLEEALRLSEGYLFGFVLFALLSVPSFGGLHLAGLLLQGLIGWFLLFIPRLLWRVGSASSGVREGERYLILGAGEAASLLVRDMMHQGRGNSIIGFLDDDPLKIGKKIAGKPVLGPISEVEQWAKRYKVNTAILAMPSVKRSRLAALANKANELGLNTRMLPGMVDVLNGSLRAESLKEVKLADLLARDPIKLSADDIAPLVLGQTALVTGAGGSIGSEIVRQLLNFGPKKIVLLGHGENSIYLLLEELANHESRTELVPVIADVADRSAMERVFAQHQPKIVFHAGAHKHVPLMESNVREAVRVNCRGTYNVAELSGEYGVTHMVLISTDKAVNPSSIMGTTKRVAELTVLAFQEKYPTTRYMAVRFGNVLGSRGSVTLKFKAQIQKGLPVTVTHPEMQRYFMLIPEAVSLVILAASFGQGGDIFVLDMGKPVKIVDLAKTMIRLHGFVPEEDIPIHFTGCRPGEKLFEELFYDPSHVERTKHAKIFTTKIDLQCPSWQDLDRRINALMQAEDTRAALHDLVPEFKEHHEG